MRYDVEAALLASERAAALTLWRMGRGRRVLAAIASTAAWIGLLGTMREIRGLPYLIVYGCCGECGCCPGCAFLFAAMGLMVAICAYFSMRYICARLETVDSEMRVAALELANLLHDFRRVHGPI